MYKKIASYILVLVIGLGLGTYFDAAHTIEEKIVTKDRVRTVVREVITERPDGTKITERLTDKKEKKDQQQSRLEKIPGKKDWGVSVKTSLFEIVPVYTIEVQRRVFSDFYFTVYGQTDNRIGAGVTFLF